MALLLLAVAFFGLGYRLVDLQVLQHAELSALAQQNTQRELFFEPRRGDILDCKGNILATSGTVKLVCADPLLIGAHQAEVAHAIAPLLQMKEADLYRELQPRVRRNEKGEWITNEYVRLKSEVPVAVWQQIQTAMSNLTFGVNESKLPLLKREFFQALRAKSIFAQDTPQRVYPNQTLAAHVLGFATTMEREVDDHDVHTIVGQEGIELTMNSKLSGVPGWRITEIDRRGREQVSWRGQDVEPCDGLNVVLTIDSVIQHITEEALAKEMRESKPISITAIVMRPRTGEILAMADLPTFNPNDPGAFSADARRNRDIVDIVEPGSVFKIVTVSGALNDGVVNLNEVFNCEHGMFLFAGRFLHDAEPHDMLTVKGIIMKSSNIGAAKIGIQLGDKRLYDYITRYGFGERTGIPLPGEAHGIVHPVKDWTKVSVAQIPMGQGIAVTRLQMILAMCAIANRGVLMSPMLVDHLEDQNGNVVVRYAPQSVRQVITPATANQMIEALKSVVTSEGTAPAAALEHYTVAGKTGTAQKVENHTYSHSKYVASFTGFFPADDPQLCISVFVDQPQGSLYGGQVAAPVFKEIAQGAANYLNIVPDVPEPGVPGSGPQTNAISSKTVVLR